MAKKQKHTELQKKFRFLKEWKTSKKTFQAGDSYETNNEKIIEFLITNKIVEKWD